MEWELASVAAASAGAWERPQSLDRLGEIVRAAVLLFCCFPPLPILRAFGEEEQITHPTLPQVAKACNLPASFQRETLAAHLRRVVG